MSKLVLTEEQFSRIVVTRARRERPDIRVKAMGTSFLMVEPEPGRQRVVSLINLYQTYCDSPSERDEVIADFLQSRVFDETGGAPESFAQTRTKIMPQLVPHSLLEVRRQVGRDLAAVSYVGELSIAFVIDEPDRYSYLQRSMTEDWGACDVELLTAAVENLKRLQTSTPRFQQFGTGMRTRLVWETYDGYDAARILLSRELAEMAALVPGNPVIGVPNRDYLVMFGDADPEFLTEVGAQVRECFEQHDYPLTARLLTLVDGNLEVYPGTGRRVRVLN